MTKSLDVFFDTSKYLISNSFEDFVKLFGLLYMQGVLLNIKY